MAAGKKEEKDDKADQQVDPAAAEAKQKKKKLFMFIGIAVLLVLVSVGATFFIVSKMMGSKHASEEEASSESSEAAEVVAPAIYYPLKPNFTVNYDVNGRQRFLQTEITLMYRDAEILKTLELHMPAVRNGLVMLLSSQVFDELQTAEGKEKLRAAALKTVQEIIAKEEAAGSEKDKESEKDDEKSKAKKTPPNIEQVLFTQFVMQ
ncbi:flagellar basal body-associated FliL family protein [Cellvibrio sp.]|uniref:flagellar basal body-associated FliL family protein n=1 Tax=Cellvibrio sp. TaxID=1965322 RepID=UPI0039647E41